MSQIQYRQVGDYKIPNIKLPEEENVTLGRYGMMRMKFLQQNKSGISVGGDIQGNITRLDNLISRLPDRLEACKEKLAETEKQIENAKAEIERPFPKEQELKEKSERLAELNALLDMDHKDNEIDEGEVSSNEPERKERNIAK
ncbi:MAG: TnpV protein [Clostridia bacterium]|nr:TnpV protein [Clostridia bacterium]